jgi:hypothetical protein
LRRIKTPTRFAGAHFIISGLTPISRHKTQMRWLPTSRPDRPRVLRSRVLSGAAAHQLQHQPRLRLQPLRLLRQPLPQQPRRQLLQQLRRRDLLQRQGLIRRRDPAPLLCLDRSLRRHVVERVVLRKGAWLPRSFALNALAGRLRPCRLIFCAFGNPFGIVFGEADPPSRLSSQQNFPKNLLSLCRERVRKR